MESISSDKEGKVEERWPAYMANMQLAVSFLFIL